MLQKLNSKKKGQGTLEYVLLLCMILAAFHVFQKYITRAFTGKWKQVGDITAGGSERTFDPEAGKTTQCGRDSRFPDVWYELSCFESSCYPHCVSISRGSYGGCAACIQACASVYCNQ